MDRGRDVVQQEITPTTKAIRHSAAAGFTPTHFVPDCEWSPWISMAYAAVPITSEMAAIQNEHFLSM